MEFEKIVAPSPKELFVEQIVKAILAGRLRPGDRLPTERELAEKMEINRSLVHSGIEELARMRFIRIEPRRGNFVAAYAKDGDFNTLTAIAKYTGGELSRPTRTALVETRNAIVGGAMIRLAKTGTEDDFRRLRELVARQREQAEHDPADAAEYMLNFNLLLTQLSGNTIFALIMNSFAPTNMSFWEKCVEHWGVDTIFKQEDKIIELLENGKGHEAALYIENIFEHYLSDHNIKR